MRVTATQAKNQFGQMLDHCQQGPVIIEKSGRRHSVLLSASGYDALLAGQSSAAASAQADGKTPGERFYAEYKDWVDLQNEMVEKYGLWCDGLVPWMQADETAESPRGAV